MKIRHHVPHGIARAKAYPPEGDQLDAIWKIINSLPPELLRKAPGDAIAILERVKAAKERHPKI